MLTKSLDRNLRTARWAACLALAVPALAATPAMANDANEAAGKPLDVSTSVRIAGQGDYAQADSIGARSGDTVEYQVEAENTSPSEYIEITSISGPNCDPGTIAEDLNDNQPGDGPLAPGETAKLTCSHNVSNGEAGKTSSGEGKAEGYLVAYNCQVAAAALVEEPVIEQPPAEQPPYCRISEQISDESPVRVDVDALPQPAPAPQSSPTPPPAVTPPARRVGTARISGRSGCLARSFLASVRGTEIARVTFYVDGKKGRTLLRSNRGGAFAARINPARYRVGVHHVTARVAFSTASGTRKQSLRFTFQRCARKAQAPQFTG